MGRRNAFYTIMCILSLTCLASFPINVILVQAQRDALFAPFALLVYGPNTRSEITPLLLRSAIITQTNHTFTINIPTGGVFDNLTQAAKIKPGGLVAIIFDSYNIYNRLRLQVLPNASNVSVSIAPVLDPHSAQHVTQMILGNSTNLIPVPSLIANPPSHNFVVPQNMTTGELYLVKAFVYFPDYRTVGVYEGTVCLASNATVSEPCA